MPQWLVLSGYHHISINLTTDIALKLTHNTSVWSTQLHQLAPGPLVTAIKLRQTHLAFPAHWNVTSSKYTVCKQVSDQKLLVQPKTCEVNLAYTAAH